MASEILLTAVSEELNAGYDEREVSPEMAPVLTEPVVNSPLAAQLVRAATTGRPQDLLALLKSSATDQLEECLEEMFEEEKVFANASCLWIAIWNIGEERKGERGQEPDAVRPDGPVGGGGDSGIQREPELEACVELLLNFGADPNLLGSLSTTSRFSTDGVQWVAFTPLLLACWYGLDRIARLLLKAGAETDCDTNVWTPLTLACRDGHYRCVQALLDAAAAVDRADDDGLTPLMWACKESLHQEGQDQCAALLLKAGAKLNYAASERKGVTALMVAACNGCEGCVRMLIDAGAAIDEQDDNGHTALVHASEGGHKACVRMLLEAGAIPSTWLALSMHGGCDNCGCACVIS